MNALLAESKPAAADAKAKGEYSLTPTLRKAREEWEKNPRLTELLQRADDPNSVPVMKNAGACWGGSRGFPASAC